MASSGSHVTHASSKSDLQGLWAVPSPMETWPVAHVGVSNTVVRQTAWPCGKSI
jgi:hypothetical protein